MIRSLLTYIPFLCVGVFEQKKMMSSHRQINEANEQNHSIIPSHSRSQCSILILNLALIRFKFKKGPNFQLDIIHLQRRSLIEPISRLATIRSTKERKAEKTPKNRMTIKSLLKWPHHLFTQLKNSLLNRITFFSLLISLLPSPWPCRYLIN